MGTAIASISASVVFLPLEAALPLPAAVLRTVGRPLVVGFPLLVPLVPGALGVDLVLPDPVLAAPPAGAGFFVPPAAGADFACPSPPSLGADADLPVPVPTAF